MKTLKLGLKNLFGGLDTKFLIKYYVISIICFILLINGWSAQGGFGIILGFISVINTILFPFAIIIWDVFLEKVITLIFGESTFILPIYGVLIYKIFRILILYVCAFLVAPLGIIYVIIKNKLLK